MAYTEITVHDCNTNGLLTYNPGDASTRYYTTVSGDVGSGNGIKFYNNGYTVLFVKNPTAGAITISILIGQTVDGQTVNSKDFSLVATGTSPSGTKEVFFGPFSQSIYNRTDTDTSYVYVEFNDDGLQIMAVNTAQ